MKHALRFLMMNLSCGYVMGFIDAVSLSGPASAAQPQVLAQPVKDQRERAASREERQDHQEKASYAAQAGKVFLHGVAVPYLFGATLKYFVPCKGRDKKAMDEVTRIVGSFVGMFMSRNLENNVHRFKMEPSERAVADCLTMVLLGKRLRNISKLVSTELKWNVEDILE